MRTLCRIQPFGLQTFGSSYLVLERTVWFRAACLICIQTMQANGAGSCAINKPVTLPCGSEIMLPSGVVVQLPMSNASWDRSTGGHCTRSEDRPIERNVLHSFADQIRDKGTFGAVCDTVKRNPVLLLPGGSLVMAASAILGGRPTHGHERSM